MKYKKPWVKRWYFAIIWVKTPPGLKNLWVSVRVSKALPRAINKPEIVEYLYQGTAVPAKTLFHD
jgi:ABC-type transport system substrate-binding protein